MVDFEGSTLEIGDEVFFVIDASSVTAMMRGKIIGKTPSANLRIKFILEATKTTTRQICTKVRPSRFVAKINY